LPWRMSLVLSWALLAEIAFASQATRYHRSIVTRLRRPIAFARTLAHTPVSMTPLVYSPVSAETRRGKRLDLFWSSITTHLTIALILACVVGGVLSLVLPRPPWFPLMIVTMPFLGAWFTNRAWEQEEEGTAQSAPLGVMKSC
jgi:hypothetical protein